VFYFSPRKNEILNTSMARLLSAKIRISLKLDAAVGRIEVCCCGIADQGVAVAALQPRGMADYSRVLQCRECGIEKMPFSSSRDSPKG